MPKVVYTGVLVALFLPLDLTAIAYSVHYTTKLSDRNPLKTLESTSIKYSLLSVPSDNTPDISVDNTDQLLDWNIRKTGYRLGTLNKRLRKARKSKCVLHATFTSNSPSSSIPLQEHNNAQSIKFLKAELKIVIWLRKSLFQLKKSLGTSTTSVVSNSKVLELLEKYRTKKEKLNRSKLSTFDNTKGLNSSYRGSELKFTLDNLHDKFVCNKKLKSIKNSKFQSSHKANYSKRINQIDKSATLDTIDNYNNFQYFFKNLKNKFNSSHIAKDESPIQKRPTFKRPPQGI